MAGVKLIACTYIYDTFIAYEPLLKAFPETGRHTMQNLRNGGLDSPPRF